jgi:catechol 2,3-dioxygenase-like lactoylglutathione lyase family enzyme
MIDHTGVSVSDFRRSLEFYRKALAPLGYVLMAELPKEATGGIGVAGLGVPPKPDFWVAEGAPNKPHVHIAFRASSRALVDAFYKAGLAAGGRDNGPPGIRAHYHPDYYGAFVLDPDGHNIEACCHDPAGGR